ncbi:MAG: FtsX-like permease family protein [Vicinamibacterales bacterium]
MTLETRARALPGVRAVTNAASVPFWSNEARGFAVDGVEDVRRLGRFTFQAGSADYFVATGTRILRGRAFDARDRDGAELVIVVSDGMARALWPDRDALGQCVHLLGDDGPDGREVAGPCRRVVGVAEESSMESFEPQREFTYYVPTAQYPEGLAPQFLLRIDGAPADAVATIRTALQAGSLGRHTSASCRSPISCRPSTVPGGLGPRCLPPSAAWRSCWPRSASTASWHTRWRSASRRFGVRTALGASARQVVQLVVGRGLGLVSVGLLIGVGAAVAASGPFDALLFHQSSRDVRVLLGIGVSLLAVAALACLAPGLRAARLDPADTLRAD